MVFKQLFLLAKGCIHYCSSVQKLSIKTYKIPNRATCIKHCTGLLRRGRRPPSVLFSKRPLKKIAVSMTLLRLGSTTRVIFFTVLLNRPVLISMAWYVQCPFSSTYNITLKKKGRPRNVMLLSRPRKGTEIPRQCLGS